MATGGSPEEDPGASGEHLDATAVRDPLVGVTLGEYRVLSRLGEGGMGVVYRGEQPVIGKPVAIKVLRRDLAGSLHVEALLKEARAVNAARHPNIIDIFGFGQTPDGQQYFVMELLEGEPLDVFLREHGGRLPPEEVTNLLKQVLAALSSAHSAGVIHRDLKPGNIFVARLVDGSRFVKLLDFGLAKRSAPNSGARSTSILVGTPLYMAPEQAVGGEVGPWTDLYAVGCVAYELLSGEPPFPGPTIMALVKQHATATPPSLKGRDPSVPAELEAMVFELLEKEPSKRPKSAAVARRALERIERQHSLARTSAGVAMLPGAAARDPRETGAPGRVETEAATRQLDAISTRAKKRPAAPGVAPPGRSRRRNELLGGAAVALLAVAGAVAWWHGAQPAGETAPVRPPVEGPARDEPPPPAAPPAPEAEDVAPVAPPAIVPPAGSPSASPARRRRPTHSAAEVDRRIGELRKRARQELPENLQRVALKQLDEIWQDSATGLSADECWADLDGFQARTFKH
ncbi:MAG: serine/threonine-protein kinase [Myxococcaceae bacterium]